MTTEDVAREIYEKVYKHFDTKLREEVELAIGKTVLEHVASVLRLATVIAELPDDRLEIFKAALQKK